MTHHSITRRSALLLIAGAMTLPALPSWAADEQTITVHKDPNCGCCGLWVRHLQTAGFTVKAIDTAELDAVKSRLGVPQDLLPAIRPRSQATWWRATFRRRRSNAYWPRNRAAWGSRFRACLLDRPAWRAASRNRTTWCCSVPPAVARICGFSATNQSADALAGDRYPERGARCAMIILDAVITCPHCGTAKAESMPADACRVFYRCTGCGMMLRPRPGDCCVFCSYGSVPCPPIQVERSGGLAASCRTE